MPDYDDTHLRKLAEAANNASVGDWTPRCLDEEDGAWDVDGTGLVACSDGDFLDEASARYIAAANPATILRLLDERGRLEGRIRAVLGSYGQAIPRDVVEGLLESSRTGEG